MDQEEKIKKLKGIITNGVCGADICPGCDYWDGKRYMCRVWTLGAKILLAMVEDNAGTTEQTK